MLNVFIPIWDPFDDCIYNLNIFYRRTKCTLHLRLHELRAGPRFILNYTNRSRPERHMVGMCVLVAY